MKIKYVASKNSESARLSAFELGRSASSASAFQHTLADAIASKLHIGHRVTKPIYWFRSCVKPLPDAGMSVPAKSPDVHTRSSGGFCRLGVLFPCIARGVRVQDFFKKSQALKPVNKSALLHLTSQYLTGTRRGSGCIEP